MTEMDTGGAQRSFGWWLRHSGSGLSSDPALRTGRAPLGAGIEDALLALRDDRTELPPAMRQLLGPLRPRTYDAAVRLLLWARHAPDGPRCHSYAAALSLIRQFETRDTEETAVERASA